MHGIGSYQKVQTETAGKEQTLVLLFEAALRFTRGGASDLERGVISQATHQLTKASDIILELHRTLDHARAPELSKTLDSLYEYIAIELMRAKNMRLPVHARNAERALAPLVNAFRAAVAQVLASPRAA
jgi:flagellar protein FliS